MTKKTLSRILLLVCALTAGELFAQTFSGGAMTGLVRDRSGAVLPGVTITARNTGALICDHTRAFSSLEVRL